MAKPSRPKNDVWLVTANNSLIPRSRALCTQHSTSFEATRELAFPGIGRRGVAPALTELQRIAELERKIGQLTMEMIS